MANPDNRVDSVSFFGIVAGMAEFFKNFGLGGAIVVLLVTLFIAWLFIHYRKGGRLHRAAPALMTSVGIFGTFCGIFLALWPVDFTDRATMDISIQELLNGMKTAFLTSLLGIGSAIAFRVVSNPDSSALEPTPEQREVLSRLDAIKQAIAGEGDSSMVTQMQKLRDENRDGFKQIEGLADTIRDALIKNLENLTKEIHDIIGKQLGESLQDLINHIEDALIKQFGKTFVEFNEATQALKKWQEDHRDHVEQLTAAFDLAAERVSFIAAECEKIPPTVERLREVVETARHDVESLNRQVEAFAGMRQQAEESFPVIKAHLDKIGEDLAASAGGFEGLEGAIKSVFENINREFTQAAEGHAKSMGEMSASMRKALGEVESETRQIAKLHGENVQQIVKDMTDTLAKAQSESAQKVAGLVESAADKFSQEIGRVASQWGGNLVAVAERAKQAIEAVEGDRR